MVRAALGRLLARAATPGEGRAGHLVARWLWLRALGLVFASAFLALLRDARGLVGDRGILPAGEYLAGAAAALPVVTRLWRIPTLFWLAAGDGALRAAAIAGLACALLLVANVWPRVTVALCTLLFLSFVSVLQDFSAYQSDGMLLEAGALSVLLAPRGRRGRFRDLARDDPPMRAAVWLLLWLWFRIYFGSGVVKLASGDPHWRDLTAMDDYYQNGPLPTWIGWYAAHLPHAVHAATSLATLVVELGLASLAVLPRPFRVACVAIVTPLQLGIILTANYAFLNWLVLSLGVLLLDDGVWGRARRAREPADAPAVAGARRVGRRALVAVAALLVVGYAALANFLVPTSALAAPAALLRPFRIGDAYGLFATMTEARYEIEFQGSRDGRRWRTYPFAFKPQDPFARPGFYAPYQPRFDWNLWFASLGPWRASPWVVLAQQRLLEGSPTVLALFRENPFGATAPAHVRTVLYRYWFTDAATKRATGAWWRRVEIGPFTGTLSRRADGRLELDDAAELGPDPDAPPVMLPPVRAR